MIGILIIAHGTLGESLIHCASHVLNKRPLRVRQARHHGAGRPRCDPAAGAGPGAGSSTRATACSSSPTCTAARPRTSPRKLLVPGRVEGVAGVNLPMLIRALTYRDRAARDGGHQGGERRLRRRAAHLAAERCTMLQREVEIINKLGLHARASAKLTQVAGQVRRRRLAVAATAGASTRRASWAS